MKIQPLRTKFILKSIFLLFLVIVTLILFSFLNNELELRMQRLKQNVFVLLEQQWERKISYESISPSIFMYLEIRDLVIFKDPASEIFKIKRLRISYNIFKLLKGKDPLQAISALEIANTQLKLNLTELQAATANSAQSPPDSGGGMDLQLLSRLLNSPYQFDLKGRNVELNLQALGSEFKLTGLFFTLQDRAGDFDFTINKAHLNMRLPREGEGEIKLSSNFKLNGSVNDNFTYSDFRLHILDLSSNYIELGEQTLQVTYSDNTLDVRKIQDKAAIDLQVVYERETGRVLTNFKTENFLPAELLRLVGPLAQYNRWLKTRLTSAGMVAFVPGTRELKYDITAEMFLTKSILPIELEINSRFNGDLKQINFDSLLLRTNIGSVDFVGNMLFDNYLPEGIVRLVNIQAIPGKVINAAFDVIRNSGSLSLRGSRLLLGASGFDLLNVDFYPTRDILRFSLEASLAGYVQEDLLRAFGSLTFGEKMQLEVNGDLYDIPVNALYKLGISRDIYSQQLYDQMENYQITAAFTVVSDMEAISFSSPAFFFKDIAHPGYYVRGSLDGDNHNLSIQNIKANWFDYSLSGDLGVEMKNNNSFLFHTALNFEGNPYTFQGIYIPERSLLLTGNYGVHLNVTFRESGEIFYYFLAQRFPLPVHLNDQKSLQVTLNLSGILDADNRLEILAPRVIFYDIPILNVAKNRIEMACRINNTGISLSNVVYTDHISTLTGYGQVDFSQVILMGGAATLNLNNKKNNEIYKLEMTLNADTINTKIQYNSAPLERLGQLVINGVATGTAILSGPVKNPDLFIKFQLEKAKINSDFVTLNAEIDFTHSGIQVHTFNFGFLEHRWLNGSGKMDFEKGDFTIEGNYKYTFFKKSISSKLTFKGSYAAIDKDSYLDSLWFSDFKASLSFENILMDDKKYNSWTLDLQRVGENLSLKGGPGKAFDLKASLQGDFSLAINAPFPVQVKARGRLAANQIEATVDNIWIDLKIFHLMLGEDILSFKEGYGIGNNLTIRGPFNDPEYSGNIRVNDAKLAFFLIPEVTQSFSANLLFFENSLSLTNARADIGQGSILVNGEFEVDHWFPRSFNLRFKSDTTTGIHVAYSFEPLIVDGYAIGEIMATGNGYDIKISGDLKTSNCSLQLNNEPQPIIENPDAAHLSIDLVFTSGNNVGFHLPSVTFPLVNCYADQGSKIFLTFKSEKKEFSLKGETSIKVGEVFYFDRNFFIKSGIITFNERGDTFDPRLTVEAEIKEITSEGEAITIILTVKDKKLSEFEPYFSSMPTRPQDEIIAILGGAITEKFAAGGLQGLAILTSDIFTQFFFFRPFEKSMRDALNLDLFSIRMPVVTNVIQETLGIGTELVPDDSFALGRYLNNTTITLGRYLANDMFLSGLLRLRDSEILTGEDFSSSDFLGLVAELEISLEWVVTPLLSFEYLFAPKLEHMNDFFIQDNAIKFEWSYSY